MTPGSTGPRRADPVRQLVRALVASATAAGCPITAEHIALVPWSTATFVGGRHLVAVTTTEPAALAHWLAALPEADLPLRDHFVASCAARSAGLHATLELLVLED